MSCDFSIGGRVEDEASGDGSFISFARVEEQLVEAWGYLRRLPDREERWVRGRVVSLIYRRGGLTEREAWEHYRVDSDDYHRDALPKPLPLRPDEVDRMDATLAWVEWVPERDRRLVGIVLTWRERTDEEIRWGKIAKRLGWGGSPDALRKRYGRALNVICSRLSPAEIRR